MRYLSGFTGSSGWLLVSPVGALLLTDARYRDQAADEALGCEVLIAADGLVAGLAAAAGDARSIGYDPQVMTVAVLGDLERELAGVEWVPAAGLVQGLRASKDAGELRSIVAALAVVEAALPEVARRIRVGDREREVAARLDFACRVAGAERMSFEPIVAAGARGALPHARPGANALAAGDLLVVDVGCVVEGYCSDLTRAVVVGSELPSEWIGVWEAVATAQQAAISAVAPGVPAADVDRAARSALAAAGLEEAFVHSVGHGVGLEIHESPRLATSSADTLEVGMVITIEPGVYLPGRGGLRLEDMVAVESDGARRLNRLGPEPIFVGA